MMAVGLSDCPATALEVERNSSLNSVKIAGARHGPDPAAGLPRPPGPLHWQCDAGGPASGAGPSP